MAMRTLMLVMLLLPLAWAAPVRSAEPETEDKPCSAIGALQAYEDVASTEDAKKAEADLAAVDAWYARCKAKMLDEDREWIDIRAASAKESLTWPRTLQEAVDSIVRGSDPKDMAVVASKKRDDLIEFHMGWGMGIRNGLGLWRGNRALLISACGGEPCHPDDASMKIIEAVWEHLRKNPPSPRK